MVFLFTSNRRGSPAKRIFSRKWLFLTAAILLAGGVSIFFAGTRLIAPVLPEGVIRKTAQVKCGQEILNVDFYFREDAIPKPLVIVVHGFSRSRHHMAGWGTELAARGFLVAVPDQPHFADHVRNAAAISGLIDLGRSNQWPGAARQNGGLGLVGYSMGGLTTLLAAATASPPVDAWVGLDPVDLSGLGEAKAPQIRCPGLALLAEPAPFNREGNARNMLRKYGGELKMIKIASASHADPEWPPDRLVQWVCGPTSPERQQAFRDRVVGFLQSHLMSAGP